jgi:lysophospholipid acyltransferase (LPLAT)-like uncharacterized protein
MRWFGVRPIFGSSNRNPIGVVKEIRKKVLENECIVIIPDGPRGPMCQINSNVIRIASMNAVQICPLSYSAKRKLTFNSWDKFILPLPFNKLVFVYGDPIIVPERIDEAAVHKYDRLLKEELDRVAREGDQLASA